MHGPLFVCVRQGTVLPMPKLCADPSVPYFPTPFAVGANAPDEPCVLQPRAPTVFFCDCLGSASCDTVEPGSCSNKRKNSCPRSVTSKDPIFLLGNSILLASRAALLFSPPPAPDQTCQKGIALRAHPFSPIVRGTCFFAGPRTLPLGCFQTFCRDTSRVPCGPFPALQQAPDRRTCHGQKMEEILDRARTCALFL